MADFRTTVKGFWLKGMETIGNAASNIASNTKSKVDEMNLMNRRSEILNDFGNKAYALWQKGEVFPAELDRQLSELQKLDERLNDLRAERLAGVKAAEREETPGKPEGGEAGAADGGGTSAADGDEADAAEEDPGDGEPPAAGEEDPGDGEPAPAAVRDPTDRVETEAAAEDSGDGEPAAAADEDPADRVETEAAAEDSGDGKPAAAAAHGETPEKAADADRGEEPGAKAKGETETPAGNAPVPVKAEKTASSAVESIRNLFNGMPTAEEAAKKVNSAMDSLDERLRQFGKQTDQQKGELKDRIPGE